MLGLGFRYPDSQPNGLAAQSCRVCRGLGNHPERPMPPAPTLPANANVSREFISEETKFMRKDILLLMVLVFTPMLARGVGNCDGSQNCYVRAGATGSGSGADWTNACSGFTGNCNVTSSALRGSTLWVATGSYGHPVFSAAVSGSTQITVRAATTANHGTSTGWSDSYAGTVTFNATTVIASNYWLFDGQTRTTWTSGYNLKFYNNNSAGSDTLCIATDSCGGAGGTMTNITLQYVEIQGDNGASSLSDMGIDAYPVVNQFTVRYSYLHNFGGNPVLMNYGGGSGDTHLYEYDYFYKNHQSYNTDHSEAMSETVANLVVRYSIFQDIISSAFISNASAGTPPIDSWEFYGNVFFWDSTFCADTRNFGPTDGILCTACNGPNTNPWAAGSHFYFYNNTVYGIAMTVASASSSSITDDFTAPTTQYYDNLWCGIGGNTSQPADAPGGGVAMDYNAYFGGTTNTSDTSAHKQTSATACTSLLNSPTPTAPGAANFELLIDTAAGNSLSSPYNQSCADGTNCLSLITRGANGTWDRGADQIGVVSPPAAPTTLTATYH